MSVGTLDASAPSGGNGGKIETSAANFKLATDAKINASAANGKGGYVAGRSSRPDYRQSAGRNDHFQHAQRRHQRH